MKALRTTLGLLLASLIVLSLRPASAQQDEPVAETSAEEQERFQRFERMMAGVKLSGKFTILGKEDGHHPKEEYEITSVKKLPRGDYWVINARIKYGKQDVSLPLPLEVKWAGDTPMITLTDFTIPGLGTFSSRVVLYNKKYAGTWTHGKVGGHLFGTIEKLEKAKPQDPESAKSPPS